MHCCIDWCENHVYRTSKNVSFHQFPKSELMQKEWMKIVKLNLIHEKSLVCSNHFHESDFVKDPSRRRLRRSAMPIILEPSTEPQVQNISNLPLQQNANILQNETICLQPPPEFENQVENDDIEDIEELENQIENEDIEDIPLSPLSSTDGLDSEDYSYETGAKMMSLKKALYSSDDSCSSSELTPNGKLLKKQLKKLRQSVFKSKRHLKTLNERFRRKQKSIARLNEIFLNLKKQDHIEATAMATAMARDAAEAMAKAAAAEIKKSKLKSPTKKSKSKSPTKKRSPIKAKNTTTTKNLKRKRAVKPAENGKKPRNRKKKQSEANTVQKEEDHAASVFIQSQNSPVPWENNLINLITEDVE
ncbi:THAP domain-containing protein 1-like [Episyrphus balteatus]|uniref:THAP domain-containing protein 1-like n=1 Tax=Episyrphus balteatus TaxID=286459 RepID=UPI0024863D97|nr:THAP domain-containing protein 1-like [Episyrphus balteatus]